MKNGLPKHHVLFPRRQHVSASPSHRAMRKMPGLIPPMPNELHNDGTESALHSNVFGVALVTGNLAFRVLEIIDGEIDETSYVHNIDILATAYELASQRAYTIEDKETCLMAADSIIRQRSYVAEALGNPGGIFILGQGDAA